MPRLLFNVTWEQGQPSLEQVREKYGFGPEEIDQDFGVIEIDPQDHLYTVLVDQEAAQRVRKRMGKGPLEGPYSNPRIEAFGPPET